MTAYDRFLSRAALGMRGSAIRQMGVLLASRTDIISFAPGYPPGETFEWLGLDTIAADVLRDKPVRALQYGSTRGYRPLLETILELMADRGVPSTLERLQVTTGSQQGLDLAGRVLMNPGDVVLTELPTYTGAITAFSNLGAQLVGVPQHAIGIDLDALDETWTRVTGEGRRVAFLYVVPNFQNPSGVLMDRATRAGLLEWAVRRDVLIVEDDPYGELYFDDEAGTIVRSLRADDEAGRVVYLSTFSKTLAPGLRVAWIDAPPEIAQRLELAKQAADMSAGTLDQQIVVEACRRGVLARQLPRLRALYRTKRDALDGSLRAALDGVLKWETARGGYFIWTRLPDGVDADALLPRAIEEGVLYVSGTAFYPGGGGGDHVRLCFASPEIDRIAEGVRRLSAAVRAAQAAAA